MITHDQLIYVLRALYPAIGEWDHGSAYLVGMPVEGNQQLGPAYIVKWTYGFPEPDTATTNAKWTEVQDAYWREYRENEVRIQRKPLLEEADVLFNKAQDSGDPARAAAISIYRQALRDLPDQPGFPDQITWPILPE